MSFISFGALGLRASFCETLAKMGFDTPTPIQSKSIPEILQGRDVLGLAQTGTGKTAAFGLPLLQRIKEIKKYEIYIEEEKQYQLSDYEYEKEDPTWNSCSNYVTTGKWKMQVVPDEEYVKFQESSEL